MSEREEQLRARPTPVEVRRKCAGFMRFQVELIQVVPRAVNVVRHATEDGQIRLLQPDSRRLLTKVFAAPRCSILKINAVERDTGYPRGAINRIEHALLNVKDFSAALLDICLDCVA